MPPMTTITTHTATPPHTAATTPRRFRAASTVGPNWFTSVMGTSILATLLGKLSRWIPAADYAALAILGIATVVLVAVSTTFTLHAIRDRAEFRRGLDDITIAPFHGAVTMGALAFGGAVLAALGGRFPRAALAVDVALWIPGTLAGTALAFWFAGRLISLHPDRRRDPTPVWALPIVSPMVSATIGAGIAATMAPGTAQILVLLVCAGCFAVSFVLGSIVFALAYRHLAAGNRLPLQGSAAIFIPLGMIGQSTAAVNLLYAVGGRDFTDTARAGLRLAVVGYGITVLLVAGGIAMFVALRVTLRALRAGMTFTLGWWSFTFPVGTMALGALTFGDTVDSAALLGLGIALTVALVGTVSLCLTRSVRYWFTGEF